MDEFLKSEMHARGWNVPRLAEACDVNPGLAARWVTTNERYRVTPSPSSCEKIATALGADLDYVLELAGHRRSRTAPPRETDPLEQYIRQNTAEMYGVLDGIPRPYWPTVIKAVFDRAIDGARDMAQILTEHQSQPRAAKTRSEPRATDSKPARSTRASRGDRELRVPYGVGSLVLAGT